jgi:hypothetical protein
MILDRLLTFTGTGTGANPNFDAITTTADATNVIDLGLFGLPPSASGGGARDIGVGDDPMLKLLIEVVVPFTSSANTLTCTLQGAPDNGTGGQGAYTVMWTSPAAVPASAMTTAGIYLANVDVPRQIPGQPMPRFLKVNFAASAALAGGSVYAGIVIDRFDQPWGATGLASAYPPGVLVPN